MRCASPRNAWRVVSWKCTGEWSLLEPVEGRELIFFSGNETRTNCGALAFASCGSKPRRVGLQQIQVVDRSSREMRIHVR